MGLIFFAVVILFLAGVCWFVAQVIRRTTEELKEVDRRWKSK